MSRFIWDESFLKGNDSLITKGLMMAIGNDGFAATEYNFTCSPSCLLFEKRHKFLEELTREWLTELVILNVCFVCLFVRVLHANVMQSIMSHFSASPPSTNGPLLTDTYEFGNVISFSHNFAATFCHFQISYIHKLLLPLLRGFLL